MTQKRLLSVFWIFCFLILPGVFFPPGKAFYAFSQEAAVRKTTAPIYPVRQLAPHVFQSKNPWLNDVETTYVRNIYEILKVNPDYDWAKAVTFRGSVWYLEIEFKPMRTITLDLPGPDGRLQRQIIWYLIYKVRNPAMVYQPVAQPHNAEIVQHMRLMKALGNHPLPAERQFYEIKRNDKQSLQFIPNFELVTLNAKRWDSATGKEMPAQLRYMDRYMPLAVQAINRKEDPGRKLHDCVTMTLREIAPQEEVWGVALWSGVNPSTDMFSIYVSGLTNAYQWNENEAKYTSPDAVAAGRSFKYKTLKLNFWCPGDETALGQRSEVFRSGIPGVDDGAAYKWIYRSSGTKGDE